MDKYNQPMRPLEILLLLLIALCCLRPLLPSRWRWLEFLPAVAVITAGLQIIVEGYRWQMLPLYLLAAGLFLFSLPYLLARRPPVQRSIGKPSLFVALGLLLTALAIALPVLFPIPQAPAPSGPYPVGTLTLDLTDESRRELYSGDPQAPRRFLVQLWYPAQAPTGGETAPWMEQADQVAPAIARWVHLPDFFLDHLRYAPSSAYPGAPLSEVEDKYPVLLFSHGWGGFRAQSSFLMQELASHGYVVAGLEHPYGSVLTVFPDGTTIPNNRAALPIGAPEGDFEVAVVKLVDQWAGDLGYTLEALAGLNADDPVYNFTGRLDLEKVGVLGHSTGGGATVEFCGRDPRCKAGLGLDAFLTPVSPTVRQAGVEQPLLFLMSEFWQSEDNKTLLTSILESSPQSAWLTLLGSDHYDFTDLPMLTPLAAWMGLKGPLDGRRVLRVIDDYALAFFNRHLKGEPSLLLESPSPDYPEIRWEW